MRDIIKQYFQGYSKKGIVKNFLKFLKNNPEVEVYLNNILAENFNWENIRNIVYSICFDEQLKHCKNCGKEMKYSKGLTHDYCSRKCKADSKEVQAKYKQTCLEKYGCENSMQSKDIQEKSKRTCLEKYGCEYVSQNKEVQEKVKQTNLERYGCENPMQSENIKQIFYDKSYDNIIPKFIQYGISPLFSKEEYTGYDKTYRWKCKCGNEFEQRIYQTNHVKECPYLPRCWKCYPKLSRESKFELELLDFVKLYFPNAHKDNKLIKPQELDIVIPELKLAIEFNGDYWHSIECWLKNHDNLDEYYGYHLNKTIETNKKGYRLIHIWENNSENIKKKLIDIFQNKENLTFIKDMIKLDRSWYNNIEIPEYKLIKELPPEMINRNGYNVENCGYLIYKRIK